MAGAAAGAAKLATKGGSAACSITKDILLRKKLGKDGAISRHVIEKMNGETISKTHQVYKNGK